MVSIRSPLLPLQAAVKTLLTTQLGAGIPVYDDVPEESVFPYVVIGDDTEIQSGWKLHGGEEVTLTIHVWSRYRGSLEVKSIMDTIGQAMTGTGVNLSASNFNAVIKPFKEFGTVFLEPDGLTRHGVLRFRMEIQDLT